MHQDATSETRHIELAGVLQIDEGRFHQCATLAANYYAKADTYSLTFRKTTRPKELVPAVKPSNNHRERVLGHLIHLTPHQTEVPLHS
ncbi:hypothetical protein PGT21_019853 [Puccinia graminis f. sp. tritici]|uniref:Uncharacterized protein n=1 Tax=Puccinia graminis f. sp. tritici TaxID=56615 RepID=A0A5B0LNX3_PUCGR|nr:hypothetical protein PGT21_019853 [Puccinia graminis f. sp. tritici]